MNADGSQVTKLTSEGGADPIWSPNGQRIAFSSDRVAGTCCEVFVMNADGTGQTQLTHSGGFAGAWSPDGKQIAYIAPDGGLVVINPDGSGAKRLTTGRPTAFSPDGKQIAFISDRDGDNDIYVMKRDGTGITQLTNDPASDEGDHAGWSPDGKRFVFSSARDGGDLDIFVMNANGSGVKQLTKNDFAEDDDPSWSPDGKHIAFHRYDTRTGELEIFVMNPDGTGQTQLTFNNSGSAVPVWTGGAITSPPTQFHFVANGDFASYSWSEFDPGGNFTFGSISVNRGGPTNAPQTSLNYFVLQCDPSFIVCNTREGFGPIPNGDFSGSRTSMRLSTNTTGNPNFFTVAGPTGVVSVDWRANGLFTQSSSGTNTFSFPGSTHRSQGSFTSASANATGSIIGVPISPNGSGDLGTNHQVTIDISY
jgi:dipeptidyl aminopeptidase/acylaminoacyl peptidase